jgi:pimeloyl-ACP methyl ester carboxylesterase
MSTLQTTPTQYIKATNGVTFAYRRLNPINSKRSPLLLHIHFRANMDFWDPLLINSLAQHRPVIIFDNSGVGRSTGEIPTTYQGWAENLIAFVRSLHLTKIDLLGFSMGGCAVQQVALTAPSLIRKLIIAGSGTSEPSPTSDISGIIWPRETSPPEPITALATAVTPAETEASLALSFFYDDPAGRAHAHAYSQRPQRTQQPLLRRRGDLKTPVRSLHRLDSSEPPERVRPARGAVHAGVGCEWGSRCVDPDEPVVGDAC